MTLNGKEILAVIPPSPQGEYPAKWFYHSWDAPFKGMESYHELVDGFGRIFKLPGNRKTHTYLGRPSEITEEVARGLVEAWDDSEKWMDYTYQSNHGETYFPFTTATESLLSWCKANGITDKHILLIKTT